VPSIRGSAFAPVEVAAQPQSHNVQRKLIRRITVKLRGRAEAPHGAEGAQFLSARGARPQAHHGPLQRLLAGARIRLLMREY
jgi:hypothetical protein